MPYTSAIQIHGSRGWIRQRDATNTTMPVWTAYPAATAAVKGTGTPITCTTVTGTIATTMSVSRIVPVPGWNRRRLLRGRVRIVSSDIEDQLTETPVGHPAVEVLFGHQPRALRPLRKSAVRGQLLQRRGYGAGTGIAADPCTVGVQQGPIFLTLLRVDHRQPGGRVVTDLVRDALCGSRDDGVDRDIAASRPSARLRVVERAVDDHLVAQVCGVAAPLVLDRSRAHQVQTHALAPVPQDPQGVEHRRQIIAVTQSSDVDEFAVPSLRR